MSSLYDAAKKSMRKKAEKEREKQAAAPDLTPQQTKRLLEKAWRGPLFHPSHLCRFRVMRAGRTPDATRGQRRPVMGPECPETQTRLWAFARPLRGGFYVRHPSVAWLKRLWKRFERYGH